MTIPFDPSKMDPKTLMELSRIVQQLPPEQISRMQTIMHNMTAGFDVRHEMEEFEKTLPQGFRDKLIGLFLAQNAQGAAGAPVESTEMSMREARLTILRAVSEHSMSPEEAERLLFGEK